MPANGLINMELEMSFKKTFCVMLTLTLLLAAGPNLVAQSKVGTTAAPFLGITVGPRAVAMGGAFTAVGGDATALYYNPGAMTSTGKSHVMFAYTKWLVDTDFNWAGVILNLGKANALGISFTQLNYGEEEVTTVLEPEGTGELWNAMDMAIGLSYCRRLTDRFSIGGTAKYIQQTLWNESASAFALDIGLLFITPFKDMKLGMSISNFGSDMQMDGKDLWQQIDLDPDAIGHNETIVASLKTEKWPLPLFFRVGLAMDVVQIKNNRLTIAVDALRPSDNTEALNVGGEFAFMNMFFLRAGYKSLFRKDAEEGLTLGTGFHLQTGPVGLTVDYTFADYGLFEDIHMLAVGVSF
jgi:hypothetical protein